VCSFYTLCRTVLLMSEQVFGLGVNQVMAYTAIANVLLVVLLTAINIYYAGHAKRQADAAREQVASSNRQSEIAAETLSLLRKQMDQQHRTDIAAVALQLKVAVHVIEDWLKRIGSDRQPQLPDEIAILPADFSVATQRANSIDHIVAENMGAASLYVAEAENSIRLMRHRNLEEPEAWKDHQQKATKSLTNARYKLSTARMRWEATTEQQS
jgi:cell division protein FtsL